ncbi:MAG: hypothetical protein GVY13_17380 [Alphaproteobacteria bacterium]|jgi:hypothetical protein|nr:hypothetical protein [Alphaproteobacteria bacterium]
MSAREITPSAATGGALGRPADPQARKKPGRRPGRGDDRDGDADGGRDRRRHDRIPTFGLSIDIDGRRFSLQDLSLGGFRVAPYDGPLTVDRDFDFMMRLAVDGEVTPFQARGRVLRVDGKGLVAVYVTREPDFYRKLSRFIERERAIRLSYGTDKAAASSPRPAFLSESI